MKPRQQILWTYAAPTLFALGMILLNNVSPQTRDEKHPSLYDHTH